MSPSRGFDAETPPQQERELKKEVSAQEGSASRIFASSLDTNGKLFPIQVCGGEQRSESLDLLRAHVGH